MLAFLVLSLKGLIFAFACIGFRLLFLNMSLLLQMELPIRVKSQMLIEEFYLHLRSIFLRGIKLPVCDLLSCSG